MEPGSIIEGLADDLAHFKAHTYSSLAARLICMSLVGS